MYLKQTLKRDLNKQYFFIESKWAIEMETAGSVGKSSYKEVLFAIRPDVSFFISLFINLLFF